MVGVDSEQDIEVMANENSYDQDPSKPVVFGGVVFPDDFSSTSNLSYTLRLTRTSLPSTGDVSSQSYEDLSLTFFIYIFLLPLLFLEIYPIFVLCLMSYVSYSDYHIFIIIYVLSHVPFSIHTHFP